MICASIPVQLFFYFVEAFDELKIVLTQKCEYFIVHRAYYNASRVKVWLSMIDTGRHQGQHIVKWIEAKLMNKSQQLRVGVTFGDPMERKDHSSKG